MTIDASNLPEQMKNARVVDGRFERLENGEWVPWPVLSIDKLGLDEVKRTMARYGPRRVDP